MPMGRLGLRPLYGDVFKRRDGLPRGARGVPRGVRARRGRKVGVTRLWRLETRLREQGADRAAHIRTYPDGQIAREVEAELAERDNLVDRVRVPTKLRGFGRSVDARRGGRCWTGSIRSSGSRSITASTSTTVPSRRRWRPGRSEAGRGARARARSRRVDLRGRRPRSGRLRTHRGSAGSRAPVEFGRVRRVTLDASSSPAAHPFTPPAGTGVGLRRRRRPSRSSRRAREPFVPCTPLATATPLVSRPRRSCRRGCARDRSVSSKVTPSTSKASPSSPYRFPRWSWVTSPSSAACFTRSFGSRSAAGSLADISVCWARIGL